MENSDFQPGPLLSLINDPSDLRKLSISDLEKLADELRQFIIKIVSKKGGHFAASLGVVELTIALHYAFNTPEDLLVWDVGHQAYGHKILTGRRDSFITYRQINGISGFPKMSESVYDAFGTGHASTSISAALGMAEAARIQDLKDRHHIAVIGDGSMTGGMAFEALNNAGVSNSNLLVVLNDNRISIDESVGALKEYLINTVTSPAWNKFREDLWQMLGKMSKFGKNAQAIASQVENSTKTFFFKQSNLFESLKFRYFGPVDGHDVSKLVRIMNSLKRIPGPKILHVQTIKGKGYLPAEQNQTAFHAPGVFDPETGKFEEIEDSELPPRYQDVFGLTLVELAKENELITGITPAMPTGSSMTYMLKEFPERSFDVGIAEQHAVTFAAGLAAQGLKPFCAIYSTFLQRAYDQVIHDVALQKLPVVFCIDRAGIVGEDGATHQGTFDIAYLRLIPDFVIAAPMNETELRNMMYTASKFQKGPFAIRYPRGRGMQKNWRNQMEEIEVGKGRILTHGTQIAVLSIGHTGNFVANALENLKDKNYSIAHYDMRFVKPIDKDLLHDIFSKFKKIITVEDGTLTGGFGSAILEFMAENNYQALIKRLGAPDKFIEHGKVNELQGYCGYNSARIEKVIIEMIND